MKETRLPHGGQILTTKRGIRDFCRNNVESLACDALVFCIAAGPDHPDYADVLYAVSSRLYTLDLLVYQSKDGIIKPDPKWYWKQLFESFWKRRKKRWRGRNTVDFLGRIQTFCSGRWSALQLCGAICSPNMVRSPLPMSLLTRRTM